MLLAASLLLTAPGAPAPAALAPTADGKLLFVAGATGTGPKADPGCVWVWDLSNGTLKDVIPGTPGDVRLIQPTADGKRFVTVGQQPAALVAVYDTAARRRLHVFDGPGKYGAEAVVSPDGAWAAVRTYGEKPELRVWNTATGERAGEVEKAAADATGALAFTSDGKLAFASLSGLAVFDPATGKPAGGWTRGEPVRPAFLEHAGSVALLPDGKGFVSVAATAKRRQSYVVRVVTEKKEWFLGETWDHAGPPTLSPDGRRLLVSAGGRGEAGTFALKLGADGAPELADRTGKEDGKLPFWGGDRKQAPAWSPWPPAGARADPAAGAFAPDGRRLFARAAGGRIQVYDPDGRELTATLFAAADGEPPAWHIVTAGGAFAGSGGEGEALTKAGKTRDPAKVKAALGVK